MKRMIVRIFLSAVLAVITIGAIEALDHLPYSLTRDRITDALSLPGGLIARVFYPAGVHTGSGAPNWGIVAAWSNVLFYLVLWFLVLSLLHFPRSKPKRA
jgi:hypothetical protein